MPKYRNKTQFVRPLVVNGKRIAVRSNAVMYSERELDLSIFNFLEKVDDATPVSPVKELKPQTVNVVKAEDVHRVRQQVSEVTQRVDSLKDYPEKLAEVKKDLEDLKLVVSELKELVLKRLDIMKKAVETVSAEKDAAVNSLLELSSVVHEMEQEIYENGTIVIEGLGDQTIKE